MENGSGFEDGVAAAEERYIQGLYGAVEGKAETAGELKGTGGWEGNGLGIHQAEGSEGHVLAEEVCQRDEGGVGGPCFRGCTNEADSHGRLHCLHRHGGYNEESDDRRRGQDKRDGKGWFHVGFSSKPEIQITTAEL